MRARRTPPAATPRTACREGTPWVFDAYRTTTARDP
jgi:hypothetical protein